MSRYWVLNLWPPVLCRLFVIKLENIQAVNYVEAVLHLVKTLKTVLSLTIIFKIDAKRNTQNSDGSIFTARRCSNACDGFVNVNGTSRFSAQCMATGGCYTVWKGISVSLKIKARRMWKCPKLSNDTPFTRVRELQFTRCKRGFSSADDRRQSITPSIHICVPHDGRDVTQRVARVRRRQPRLLEVLKYGLTN